MMGARNRVAFAALGLLLQILSAHGFLSGVDLSALKQIEDGGGVYMNSLKKPADPLRTMKAAGINAVRLRLWVNPVDKLSNLDYVVQTASRVKALGMNFLLNIHYSDTWADPGQQAKPAAWANLSFYDLVLKVKRYTTFVVQLLVLSNVMPDQIQIGNEISYGLLWPDGALTSAGFTRAAQLINAGISGVRASTPVGKHIDIVLHIDDGSDNVLGQSFYGTMIKNEVVDFDVIGLSYYPFYHDTLADLEANMIDMATRYNRDVAIVETAYPFTFGWNGHINNVVGSLNQTLLDKYPATPAGQEAFLTDVRKIVQRVPNKRGRGVYYWGGESISTKKVGSDWENMALFDFNHVPLPGMKALAAPAV
jgi:arabinogalactan endo-1,4-beta-galactosidase